MLAVDDHYNSEPEPCANCYTISDNLSVKGRLKESYAYWRDVLHAPDVILSIIKNGYVLPIVYEPKHIIGPNTGSVYAHETFVSESVAELLVVDGVLRRCRRDPWFVALC